MHQCDAPSSRDLPWVRQSAIIEASGKARTGTTGSANKREDTMTGMLAIKLKNNLKAAANHDDYDFAIKNVSINGAKVGATGFVKNNRTGKFVYVCTDFGILGRDGQLFYRTAKDAKDYTGGTNKFGDTREEGFAQDILALMD